MAFYPNHLYLKSFSRFVIKPPEVWIFFIALKIGFNPCVQPSLVDGIQNKMGMPKSAQFLGFWGDDVDVIIDLQNEMNIDSILLHSFEQKASWIYRPKEVNFLLSTDGINYTQNSGSDSDNG